MRNETRAGGGRTLSIDDAAATLLPWGSSERLWGRTRYRLIEPTAYARSDSYPPNNGFDPAINGSLLIEDGCGNAL